MYGILVADAIPSPENLGPQEAGPASISNHKYLDY